MAHVCQTCQTQFDDLVQLVDHDCRNQDDE